MHAELKPSGRYSAAIWECPIYRTHPLCECACPAFCPVKPVSALQARATIALRPYTFVLKCYESHVPIVNLSPNAAEGRNVMTLHRTNSVCIECHADGAQDTVTRHDCTWDTVHSHLEWLWITYPQLLLVAFHRLLDPLFQALSRGGGTDRNACNGNAAAGARQLPSGPTASNSQFGGPRCTS